MIHLIENILVDIVNKTYIINGILSDKYIEPVIFDKIKNIDNCIFTNNDGDNDFIFNDNIYKINIKLYDCTNNNVLSSNLMSIDRIRKILQIDTNHIIYIFIGYKLQGNQFNIENINITNIENINWDCLTIQNLGKGQLQMKNNSEPITFNNNIIRKDWLDELKKQAIQYYDKMILKITEYKMELEKEN